MGRKVPGLWVYRRRTQILNVLLILIPNRRSSLDERSYLSQPEKSLFGLRDIHEVFVGAKQRVISGEAATDDDLMGRRQDDHDEALRVGSSLKTESHSSN
ncbi:hypothetical protein KCU98_g205, partial [Aureobasidium melanogenum]